jgi:glycosyltransferase involved in cell wall biosynthesis
MNIPSGPEKQKTALAIVHDQFVIRGGGERLVLDLVNALRADLIIGSHHPDSFPLQNLPGQVQNLQANTALPGLKTRQLARAFQTRTRSLSDYASVLYSGLAAPLAVSNHRQGRNVFYCHTPPRFLYDKQQHYLNQLNPLAALALRGLNRWFRPRYEKAVDCMDLIVANSSHIQQRIRTHLGRDSVVVHPPCQTERFAVQATTGDFYLSTARLDPLKRVDVVIRAFRRLPHKKLVVASGGSERQRLQKLAQGASNIHFTGWLDDQQYPRLLAEALATIYIPRDEDFGMSPVESMAAGTPVFCSDHGGLLETVIDGETGFYIDESRLEEALVEKIQSHQPAQLRAMAKACQARAQHFDSRLFQQRMAELLV